MDERVQKPEGTSPQYSLQYSPPARSTVERSLSIAQLAAALSKAQAEIKGATKDAKNPFFKSKYADLASVWEAFRVPMTAHDLSLVQLPSSNGPDSISVTSLLMHKSGEYIGSTLTMYPTKQDPQSMGSCLTYARRYSAQALLGICPEDDDANEASGKNIVTPQTETFTPNVWVKAALVSLDKESDDKPYLLRFATEEGPYHACSTHRLPMPEEEINALLGSDVEYQWAKKGKFIELVGLRPCQSATKEDDQWHAGTLKSYGQNHGKRKDGAPYTRHSLEITENGKVVKLSTFSLSELSRETKWTPELLEARTEEQVAVRFGYEQSGNFKNLIALEVGEEGQP